MPPVLVHENIARIENAIGRFTDELSDLEKRKEEIKIERTRLEGCLITFEGFARAGIEEIVPEHEKNQRDSQKECDQGGDESHTDTHEQGERESCSDPRAHTHEQKHDKTPLEELYAKYRTM